MTTSARSPAESGSGTPELPPVHLLDAAVGASALVLAAAKAAGRQSGAVVRPVARTVLHPPGLADRHHPGAWLAQLARHGERQRVALRQQLSGLLDDVVPAVFVELLRRLDLTAAVRRYVDLDELVATVDLDAILDRLDLTALVRERLDLDLLVSSVDIDAVAARLDVDAVAARLQLDAVAARLDVDAVARRLDLDAVIGRVDLVGLAEQVIDAIDLPEIIRESTASVTSDAVRGVRMQGIAGDEAVGRVLDRVLVRRGRRARRAAEAAVASDDLSPEVIPPQRGTEASSRQP